MAESIAAAPLVSNSTQVGRVARWMCKPGTLMRKRVEKQTLLATDKVHDEADADQLPTPTLFDVFLKTGQPAFTAWLVAAIRRSWRLFTPTFLLEFNCYALVVLIHVLARDDSLMALFDEALHALPGWAERSVGRHYVVAPEERAELAQLEVRTLLHQEFITRLEHMLQSEILERYGMVSKGPRSGQPAAIKWPLKVCIDLVVAGEAKLLGLLEDLGWDGVAAERARLAALAGTAGPISSIGVRRWHTTTRLRGNEKQLRRAISDTEAHQRDIAANAPLERASARQSAARHENRATRTGKRARQPSARAIAATLV
jgi:hypothetical protein